MSDDQIAVELGTLGYPGFAYLASDIQADQAEVLLDALDRDDLDVRVAEGLPWIPLAFPKSELGLVNTRGNAEKTSEQARVHSRAGDERCISGNPAEAFACARSS